MVADSRERERPPLRSLCAGLLAALLTSTALCAFVFNKSKPAVGTIVTKTVLVDQSGKWTSLGGLRGKLVVLNFIYTGCGRLCPVQTEQLALVQRALPASLRERVQFLSISLDPAHDTPETLTRFAFLHGADLANWSFVTGEPSALASLAISFAAQSRDASRGEHSTDIRLLDFEGTVVQRYSGVPVAVGRIVDEVRQLALSKITVR